MKKLAIILVLVLCLTQVVIAANAATFKFSFNSTSGTQNSNNGTRVKANGTDWDLTITSGSLSSSNVLGIRPRRVSNDASIGAYKLYKQTGTWGRTYSVTVKNKWVVQLRAKKDTSSTVSAKLTADGAFTP